MDNPSRPSVALVVAGSDDTLEDEFAQRYAESLDVTTWRLPVESPTVEAETLMIREALPPLLEKVSAWHPDLVLLATTAPGRIGGLGLDHEVARSIERATGAEVLTGTDALVMALDVLGPTQIAVFVHSSRVRAAQTASLVTETGYHAAWVRSVGIGGDEPALSVEPEAMTDGIAMAMNGVNVDCVLLESTDWTASGSTTSLGAVFGLPVLTTVGCLMDLMDAWVELASP